MMNDQYPRVPQAQLEIWLDSPVTKAYLQCLQWSAEQVTEVIGSGSLVDQNSSDRTFGAMRSAVGQRSGLELAGNVTEQLTRHGMLEIPKEGEDGEET